MMKWKHRLSFDCDIRFAPSSLNSVHMASLFFCWCCCHYTYARFGASLYVCASAHARLKYKQNSKQKNKLNATHKQWKLNESKYQFNGSGPIQQKHSRLKWRTRHIRAKCLWPYYQRFISNTSYFSLFFPEIYIRGERKEKSNGW